MTPHDRSKWARIVAYALSRGEAPAEIEARLLDYASELTAEELATAKREGAEARQIGQLISAGESDVAQGMMGGIEDAGARAWQVVAAYGTSTTGDLGWRNVVVEVPAGSTPGAILTAIEDAIESSKKTEGTDPSAYVPGLLDIIYVAPLMGE